MIEQPLVTIGCAVYNGEKTLARALEPLVGQDYANVELLIADDCSTDRSWEICGAYARRDPRVRLIRNPRNIGLTANFNHLIDEAKGKYFLFADQDDVRDPTFVRKTVAALEAEPGAVLCQSHIGAFIGDPADLKYIVTLKGLEGIRSRMARGWQLLTHASDLIIYGLIRTDALRKTRLWRHDLGAADVLLFELALQGAFVQVPEVLYRYSGWGIKNRMGPNEEYARLHPGTRKPWYYQGFLVLAANQTGSIFRSSASVVEKIALFVLLWSNVLVVFFTKFVYRVLDRIAFGHLPVFFTRLCAALVDSKPDIVYVSSSPSDENLFPKTWVLKGRS